MRTVLFNMICLFLGSCCSYKIPTSDFIDAQGNPNKTLALSHWLYDYVPRHRCQIRWYDVGHWTTWALFGNDDDGIFGEEPSANYKLDKQPSFAKALQWTCRNPFHNFCFYAIGSAHRINSEFALLRLSKYQFHCCCYRPCASQNFPSKGSCFYLALHGGKPYLSFRIKHSPTRHTDFYCGWRYRGNFGLKFHPYKLTSIN